MMLLISQWEDQGSVTNYFVDVTAAGHPDKRSDAVAVDEELSVPQ